MCTYKSTNSGQSNGSNFPTYDISIELSAPTITELLLLMLCAKVITKEEYQERLSEFLNRVRM